MIGGTMLLCAVGAMVVLAMWSLAHDDSPDAAPRDGLLALKNTAIETPVSKPAERALHKARRNPSGRSGGFRRNDGANDGNRLNFDDDEMEKISEEIKRREFLDDLAAGAR